MNKCIYYYLNNMSRSNIKNKIKGSNTNIHENNVPPPLHIILRSHVQKII